MNIENGVIDGVNIDGVNIERLTNLTMLKIDL
jgi:hypothetical protein